MMRPYYLFVNPSNGNIYACWADQCHYHNDFNTDGKYEWVVNNMPRGMIKIGDYVGMASDFVDLLAQERKARANTDIARAAKKAIAEA